MVGWSGRVSLQRDLGLSSTPDDKVLLFNAVSEFVVPSLISSFTDTTIKNGPRVLRAAARDKVLLAIGKS